MPAGEKKINLIPVDLVLGNISPSYSSALMWLFNNKSCLKKGCYHIPGGFLGDLQDLYESTFCRNYFGFKCCWPLLA